MWTSEPRAGDRCVGPFNVEYLWRLGREGHLRGWKGDVPEDWEPMPEAFAVECGRIIGEGDLLGDLDEWFYGASKRLYLMARRWRPFPEGSGIVDELS